MTSYQEKLQKLQRKLAGQEKTAALPSGNTLGAVRSILGKVPLKSLGLIGAGAGGSALLGAAALPMATEQAAEDKQSEIFNRLRTVVPQKIQQAYSTGMVAGFKRANQMMRMNQLKQVYSQVAEQYGPEVATQYIQKMTGSGE